MLFLNSSLRNNKRPNAHVISAHIPKCAFSPIWGAKRNKILAFYAPFQYYSKSIAPVSKRGRAAGA
jgi:hypothetical protein